MKANSLPETFVIEDLETLKVIADPLRTQILEVLIPEAHNVRQIAEKLGLAPSKLYYHINLLEKHGLIRVVEMRQVANLSEKVYRAAAADLDVHPDLLSFKTEDGQENIHNLITTVIDATRQDMLRSLKARAFELERGAKERNRRVIVNRTMSRLSEDVALDLAGRINELVKEFSAAQVDSALTGEDTQPYALTIAFYPSFYFRQSEGTQAPDDFGDEE